ncbi:MAG: GSU2403 family nucleotidyltransferase fold protein [Polaromonas sp.]
MIFEPHDYIPISSEAQRNIANLEQAYSAWLDTARSMHELPASLYWAQKNGADYLVAKLSAKDNGTAQGPRSVQTEQQHAQYLHEKQRLQARLAQQESILTERVALYKTRLFRLPQMINLIGTILRQLDIEELLGIDVMVVGTNAFSAYELACGVRFPTGNEATEDFDLTWCRETKAALTFNAGLRTRQHRKSLFAVLREIDPSYKINRSKPYQAINDKQYEVELLAAPSVHPLPKAEAFAPMYSLFEQESLLLGRPVSCVLATENGKACPLVVPDPRFMALHKLWLSRKPERKSSKKDKDQRQGYVLLDAVRHFLSSSHPLNVDFVLDLPEDLRLIFDAWCKERHFVPAS